MAKMTKGALAKAKAVEIELEELLDTQSFRFNKADLVPLQAALATLRALHPRTT